MERISKRTEQRKHPSMAEYIPIVHELTPAWLCAVLRQSGALPRGEVTTLVQEATGDFRGAQTHHLHVHYSSNAPSTAPKALLLKRNRDSAWARAAGAAEVTFYSLLATLPSRCLAMPLHTMRRAAIRTCCCRI